MFLKNGFQGFISKPIDLIQLDNTLNKWIRDRQDEETLAKAENEYQEILRQKNLASKESHTPVSPLLNHYIPGLNIAEGLSRCDNNENQYFPLLESWAKHTRTILEEISNLDSIDIENYAIKVHGIKGSAFGICAQKVGEFASDLETAARRGDLEFVRKSNQAFIVTAYALIADIHTILSEFRPKESDDDKEMKDSPDRETLQSILDNCAVFKTSQIKKDIKKLDKYTYINNGELVDWLKEQVDNLEYESIRERLSKLLT
jgi:HPt (histidine-containing phosphotransfer) domain-containing protein